MKPGAALVFVAGTNTIWSNVELVESNVGVVMGCCRMVIEGFLEVAAVEVAANLERTYIVAEHFLLFILLFFLIGGMFAR